MRPAPLLALGTSLLSSILLTGCSVSFSPSPSSAPAPTTEIGTISGSVYGGRQPIVGAQIFLFQAGTSADAGPGIAASTANASVSKLVSFSTGAFPTTQDTTGSSATNPTYGDYYVTTDSNGSFTITGEYTCTQNTQLYLYSKGGKPDGITSNSAAGLLAVLGNCPAGGSLAAQVPLVEMNEVSTIAAAYALAGYATDATHISSKGSTLSTTGIANAFANAAQLYAIGALSNGTSAATALATTPGSVTGNVGTVPQSLLNSLGNSLAACVNTTGPSSGQCTIILGVLSGGATGTVPTDTASAAINIAHNPTYNVANIFGAPGSIGYPFSPHLAAASPPANFTVQITFTGNGLNAANAYFSLPHSIAVDSTGNIWVAGYSGVVEFSRAGVSTFRVSPYNASTANIAFDAASNFLYVVCGYGGSQNTSLLQYSTSSNSVVGASVSGSDQFTDVAVGPSGYIFTGDLIGPSSFPGSVVSFSGANRAYQTSAGVAGLPYGIAFTPSSVLYSADSLYARVDIIGTSGPTFGSSSTYSAGVTPFSVAVDSASVVWTGNNNRSISKSSGSTYFPTGSATNGDNITSIAIDGNNNVWAADQAGNAVVELNNSGTALSGAGFVAANGTSTQTQSVAIDGSGNVWFNSANDAVLRELVGAATPVVTPIAYGVLSGKLGTRP